MSRRFYPSDGPVRDLPWIVLYAVTLGLQLVAAWARGLLFYVPLWAVVAITGHSMDSFGANLALYSLVFGPLVWSVTALVYPLGAGRAWNISSGGRAPSERERDLVEAAINEIQAHNPGVRAPRLWFVLDEWDFNAAIFGDAMMVTAGLVDHDGLTAVIAHELGHLNSTDSHLTVAVTRLGTPARILVPVRNAIIGEEGAGCLFAPLTGMIGLASGYVILRLVSPLWDAWWRTREYRADEYAARLGLGDELADALRREVLENDRPTPFQFIFGASHPYTEHRIDALERYARQNADVTA